MNPAILIPFTTSDPHRDSAYQFVAHYYRHHFPKIRLITGSVSGEWSKGAAVADALRYADDATELVIADADSFLFDPGPLTRAIELVAAGAPWVVPHGNVYRLRPAETERLYREPTTAPRLGHTARAVYEGPPGGGISVVSRAAYDRVNGIDPAFLGWGGEDVAFGWALDTLAGPHSRLNGTLVHLWHPHPAPKLRGSEESERLVALYRSARGVRRRMESVVSGNPWSPSPELPEAIRFRMTANRNTLRLPSGGMIYFTRGIYETSDIDEVDQLRGFQIVKEERK